MGAPGGNGGTALSTGERAAPPASPPTPGPGLRPRTAAGVRGAAAHLFTAAPPRTGGRAGLWAAVGAVLLGTAISLLRQPGAGALNTIWAEDGQVFLGAAVRHGPLAPLTTSYAGYYHLLPRLLADPAILVPPGAAAAVLAVEAALCTALAALLVYVASAGQLRSRSSRLLVSAIVVVVPVAQDDILNSIANLHWYGLYVLFWVLIWTPRTATGRLVAVAAVVLVAASDILAVVFVPLALFRAARRRDDGGRERHGVALAVALVAGLAPQFAGLLAGSSSRTVAIDPVLAASSYVLRAVPAPLVGSRWSGDAINGRSLLLAALAWAVVGMAVLLAYARVVRPAWMLALVAALHSAGLYVLPVLLTGVATPRYAVAPAMLVVTALVALLQPGPGPASAGRRVRAAVVPLGVLAVLLGVVAAVNLRVDNLRADGPRWSTELDRARTACADRTGVVIPIAPRAGTPWAVDLPCDYVRSGS